MRLLIIIMLFSLIYIVSGKNHVKTLTESMGQEVIEIGNPIKELPMGLEEEPSADNEDDDKEKITSNTVQPATKKETKKTTTKVDDKKKLKDIEKIDGLTQDDEEARIEKELAEIYKDTAGLYEQYLNLQEYKSDSTEEKEVAKEPLKDPTTSEDGTDGIDGTSSEELDKPIGRQRNSFKFQPETTDKAAVELFRTSIDEINCNSRQKFGSTPATDKKESNRAFDNGSIGIALLIAALCSVFICT